MLIFIITIWLLLNLFILLLFYTVGKENKELDKQVESVYRVSKLYPRNKIK